MAKCNKQCLEFLREGNQSKDRGFIVETYGELSEVVCTLPRVAYEFDECQYSQLPVGKDQIYTRVIEGRHIIVFFHKGKWNVSATNRINAFEEFGGEGRSIGDSFRRRFLLKVKKDELFEAFEELLDKELVYNFITPNEKKSRFVCLYKEDEPPVLVGVRDKDGNEVDVDIEPGMKPAEITFDTHEELKKALEEINIYQSPGFITKVYEEDGENYMKIYSERYSQRFYLKSKPNNLPLSYLEQRTEGRNTVELFKENWPELDYENIERTIKKAKAFFERLKINAKSYSQGDVAIYLEENLLKTKFQRPHLETISEALKKCTAWRGKGAWRLEKNPRTLWILMKILGDNAGPARNESKAKARNESKAKARNESKAKPRNEPKQVQETNEEQEPPKRETQEHEPQEREPQESELPKLEAEEE